MTFINFLSKKLNYNIKTFRASEKGMTLIEIIVVIVILGVLIAFLTGGLFEKADEAKAKLNQSKMAKVKHSIDQFRLQYNGLPGSLEDLTKCTEKTGQGCIPVTSVDEVKDIWGNALTYSLENGGRTFRLKSFGADGREGGEGANFDFSITGP